MAASSDGLAVDLQVVCDAPELPSRADIEAWLELALAESGKRDSDGLEVSVRVVDSDESRALNRRFRGIDRPTNVLAFPAELPGLPQSGPRLLGDLVICAPVVAAEATEQGKDTAAHWGHMLVHGLLHLLGYDHASAAQARRMESLEVAILGARGLKNPYRDKHLS